MKWDTWFALPHIPPDTIHPVAIFFCVRPSFWMYALSTNNMCRFLLYAKKKNIHPFEIKNGCVRKIFIQQKLKTHLTKFNRKMIVENRGNKQSMDLVEFYLLLFSRFSTIIFRSFRLIFSFCCMKIFRRHPFFISNGMYDSFEHTVHAQDFFTL